MILRIQTNFSFERASDGGARGLMIVDETKKEWSLAERDAAIEEIASLAEDIQRRNG